MKDDDDQITEALRSRADAGRGGAGAWEAIDQGREHRRRLIRRRQVVVGVVAGLAVVGLTAAVLALRDGDSDEQVVTTKPPKPAAAHVLPSETAVVAATADGRVVGFDLLESDNQTVLWEAPDHQQIAQVAVDQAGTDIYLTLLNTRKADSPEWCAPTIVRLVEGADGYEAEPWAVGSHATVLDGRLAFFEFHGGCAISFGARGDWPELYGSDQIGVIEDHGAGETLDLGATIADYGAPPELTWTPEGLLGLETGGSLVLVDPDNPEAVLPAVPFGEPVDPGREGTHYLDPAFRENSLYLVANTHEQPESHWLTEWTAASGGAPYIEVNPSMAPLRGWRGNLDVSSAASYVLWTTAPGEREGINLGYEPEDYRLSWLDRGTSQITELDEPIVDAVFAHPAYEPGDEVRSELNHPTDTTPETVTPTTECVQKSPPPPDTPASDPDGAPLRVLVMGPAVPGTLVPFTFEKTPDPDEGLFTSPHFGLEMRTAGGWEERFVLIDVDSELPRYEPSPTEATTRGTEVNEGVLPIPEELEPGWHRLTTHVVVTDSLGVTLRTYTVYTLLEVQAC